jgi:hypothetical protein
LSHRCYFKSQNRTAGAVSGCRNPRTVFNLHSGALSEEGYAAGKIWTLLEHEPEPQCPRSSGTLGFAHRTGASGWVVFSTQFSQRCFWSERSTWGKLKVLELLADRSGSVGRSALPGSFSMQTVFFTSN